MSSTLSQIGLGNAANVIKACVALHNFLLDECPDYIQASDLVMDEEDCNFPTTS